MRKILSPGFVLDRVIVDLSASGFPKQWHHSLPDHGMDTVLTEVLVVRRPTSAGTRLSAYSSKPF